MASSYPLAMRRLIHELVKLPSVGEKSAARLAYFMLSRDGKDSLKLADAIREAVETTTLCDVCFFLSETPRCSICSAPNRDTSLLCVVEKPADVFALERSSGFRGLYHVLHGVWSPLKGLSTEATKIQALLTRISDRQVRDDDPLSPELREVILATGTTVEGDATALYIANCVEQLGIPITRIAQGLPKGGELEYADDLTLSLSLEGRRRL